MLLLFDLELKHGAIIVDFSSFSSLVPRRSDCFYCAKYFCVYDAGCRAYASRSSSGLARHPASYTQQYFAQGKQSERLGTKLVIFTVNIPNGFVAKSVAKSVAKFESSFQKFRIRKPVCKRTKAVIGPYRAQTRQSNAQFTNRLANSSRRSSEYCRGMLAEIDCNIFM